MLLAIDSSIGTSVALVDRSGRVLSSRDESGHLSHAEVVGSLIRGALDDAGAEPRDVEAVASGMGPGPFTGLRIGIAAARAFGVARRIPVVPIVSHDAIAAAHLERSSGRELVVVTDARRREVAWSRYRGTDEGGAVRVSGPELAEREGFVVDDAERLDAVQVSAVALGRLAGLVLDGHRAAEADRPVYLRAPDVTLSTRKRVSQ